MTSSSTGATGDAYASDADRLISLVRSKDSKIKGVVTALTTSGQGTEITTLAAVMPGDIVQMWREVGQEARGHTGIVKSVNASQKQVVLIGAHVDGVGAKSFRLDTSANGWPIWFVVRPKP